MKAYGVVFCCLATHAVKIMATTGYSKKQFLVCYRKFTSNTGLLVTVLSDHGTQLLSAAMRLMDPKAKELDWEKEGEGSPPIDRVLRERNSLEVPNPSNSQKRIFSRGRPKL